MRVVVRGCEHDEDRDRARKSHALFPSCILPKRGNVHATPDGVQHAYVITPETRSPVTEPISSALLYLGNITRQYGVD